MALSQQEINTTQNKIKLYNDMLNNTGNTSNGQALGDTARKNIQNEITNLERTYLSTPSDYTETKLNDGNVQINYKGDPLSIRDATGSSMSAIGYGLPTDSLAKQSVNPTTATADAIKKASDAAMGTNTTNPAVVAPPATVDSATPTASSKLSIGGKEYDLSTMSDADKAAVQGLGVTVNPVSSTTLTAFTAPTTTSTPTVDYAAIMKQALADQRTASEAMYNQQAAEKAARIRQAIEAQAQQAEAVKADYTNQMNTSINTLNTERAKIPGQTETANNAASATGKVNAQHIRNALTQMGLLQSGESASQQLLNDTTVANEVNANRLQGQQLDTQYGNQIASSQADLASKVKAINDAMAIARASGDENALAALTNAQNQIALAAAQSNTDLNNFQYKIGRDTVADSQWDKTFDHNFQYKIGRDTVADSQWDKTFDQNAKQFEATTGLQQQQINNQASQFARNLGLSQQQLANTIAQQGVDNAYKDKAFAQAANQFAQQMGLSQQQYASGLSQWAQTFSYDQNQDLINNRFKWNEQDTYNNTNPITGEDLTSENVTALTKTGNASSVTTLPASIATQYPNATEITSNGRGGYTFTDDGRRRYVTEE